MQGIVEYAFGDEFDELKSTVMKNLQVDRGIQNVFTPIKDIEEKTGFKFSSVLNKDTKTIGILFNTEFIRYILKSFDEDYLNTIEMTFFYDSQFDKKEVERLCVEYRYKKSIELISIEDFNENNKDIKVIMNAMKNKKFDVVFSNPPYGDRYDNALDLKIVETINANKKVILQPANWVYADKSAGKAKTWTDKLGKYITDIYFCDFNALMGIKLRAYGGIIVYDYINKIDTINIVNCVLNESYKVNTIYDITKYGSMYNTLVKPFINKIKNKYKVFVDQKFSYDVNSDFAFRFSRYNGTAGQTDIYSPINKAGMKNHFIDKTFINNKQKNNFMWFIINDFKTNDERINFYNYGKTKCFRFVLSIYKNDVNFSSRSVSLVPWLDFTKEWNDYTLCKEFGISKDLWKYIDKFIPDYYDDYDSKIPKRKPTIGPADQLALIYF